MAVIVWLTVIIGTWVIYPWYQANSGESTGGALNSPPQAYLQANENLKGWDEFGMEWKQHIAWFAPILTTAVAYVVIRYGSALASLPRVRNALLVLYIIGFAAAGLAAIFGALISRVAPVQ